MQTASASQYTSYPQQRGEIFGPPASALQQPVFSAEDRALVHRMREGYQRIMEQLSRRIIGQRDVLEQLLISFFSGGHCLLVGVPGLAKTLMIRSLSEVLGLEFQRIQFTPDLMPSDITGTDVIADDEGERGFKFLNGPIFTNMLLADEINRTPPKTQAALLEAMEEGTVHVGGRKYEMPQPFFVLATQNPIEQEGTYPLPAAAQDRFMFHIHVDYPDEHTELVMVEQTTSRSEQRLSTVLSKEEIVHLLQLVRRLPISEDLMQYAVRLARASRTTGAEASAVNEWVAWGASPRAPQALILGAKARALLAGRERVVADDIRAISLPVMRHRMACNFHAESEGVSTDDVIKELLRDVPRPPGDIPPERDPLLGYRRKRKLTDIPILRWLWGADTARTRAEREVAEKALAPSRIQELEARRYKRSESNARWPLVVASLSLFGALITFVVSFTLLIDMQIGDTSVRQMAVSSFDPNDVGDVELDATLVSVANGLFGLAFLVPTAVGLFARQDWARLFGLFTYSLVAFLVVLVITLGAQSLFPHLVFLPMLLVIIYMLATRRVQERPGARKRPTSPIAEIGWGAAFVIVVTGAALFFREIELQAPGTNGVWPAVCIFVVGWLANFARVRLKA